MTTRKNYGGNRKYGGFIIKTIKKYYEDKQDKQDKKIREQLTIIQNNLINILLYKVRNNDKTGRDLIQSDLEFIDELLKSKKPLKKIHILLQEFLPSPPITRQGLLSL